MLATGEIALQDSALQALGQLFIARPGLMLLERSVAVTTSALLPTASLVLKHRILRNLAELLKVCAVADNILMTSECLFSRTVFDMNLLQFTPTSTCTPQELLLYRLLPHSKHIWKGNRKKRSAVLLNTFLKRVSCQNVW